MNEADKVEFSRWYSNQPTPYDFENWTVSKVPPHEIWQAALDHRDAQQVVAQGEPVALYPCGFKKLHEMVIEKAAYVARRVVEGEVVTESMRTTVLDLTKYAVEMSRFFAKHPLYTHPPAEVVRELAVASEDAKNTLANPPERIYLQVGDVDAEFPGEIQWRDVTWCEDEVDHTDLMYVRSDLAIESAPDHTCNFCYRGFPSAEVAKGVCNESS